MVFESWLRKSIVFVCCVVGKIKHTVKKKEKSSKQEHSDSITAGSSLSINGNSLAAKLEEEDKKNTFTV